MELPAHAGGEVTGSDRLQQAREGLQVAVGSGHQGVEAVHHHPEVVLEILGIAAGAEVAIGGALGKVLDGVIDRRQVALDLGHGVAEHGLVAGQGFHVFAQVADSVLAHDLRQPHHHGHMRGGQVVVAAHDGGVVARKRCFVQAEVQLALIVPALHFLLAVQDFLQLLLHLAHAGEQATSLVGAAAVHADGHVAGGNRIGHVRGLTQAIDQATTDQPAAGQRHQHRDAAADDHRPTAAGLGGLQGCAALDQQFVFLRFEVDQQLTDLAHRRTFMAGLELRQQCGQLCITAFAAQRDQVVLKAHELLIRRMQALQAFLLHRVVGGQGLGVGEFLFELHLAVVVRREMLVLPGQHKAARARLDVDRGNGHGAAGADDLIGVVVHGHRVRQLGLPT
ncbi:hypothetical protein XP4B_21780 [Xanthomonas perforans]|nr:hypothetical protein XP4B_21780 [Xanthomonas perforans]